MKKLGAINAMELESVLMSALAKLDERGTDDSVTKAMSIVSATFEALSKGKRLTADKAYRMGIKYADCERL
jgi:hypothetical protein